MSCGMSDSTIKVFWLNPFKVKEMLGLYEGQTNYLGTDGLKVQLYAELLQKDNQFKQKHNHIVKQVQDGILDGRQQERYE